MMPGTTNFPATFTTLAPGGAAILDEGPRSRMRPPSMTIETSFCGAPPAPSIKVARLSTVTWALVMIGANSKIGRTNKAFHLPIENRNNIVNLRFRATLIVPMSQK